MEAETADSPGPQPALGHGIAPGRLWQVGVEGGVEGGHLREVRKGLSYRLDHLHRNVVVQRSKDPQLLDRADGRRIEPDSIPKAGTTVDHPVAHSLDRTLGSCLFEH